MEKSFYRVTSTTHSDAVIVLKGLGADGIMHSDMVAFLESQGLEVSHLNRDNDRELREDAHAIAKYQQGVRDAVNLLIARGKRVHLVGVSFGGYLSLKIAEERRIHIASIVAIAPLIDPFRTVSSRIIGDEGGGKIVKLSEERQIIVLQENIESVKNQQPKHIIPPGLIILGSDDGFETPENLELVEGSRLSKHIIPGVRHHETTGHPETRRLMTEFYARVLAHKKN